MKNDAEVIPIKWSDEARAGLPDPVRQPVLRAQEVAKFLRCGERAVYESIARGEIPSVRLGRVLRVPTSAFLRWLDGEV
jgi:excisionase family DNA binding protein